MPCHSREQKPDCWLSARRGPLALSRSRPRRDRGTVGPSGSYVPPGRKLCRGFPRGLGLKPAPSLWLALQMGDPRILGQA